jgi:hypothetical protein
MPEQEKLSPWWKHTVVLTMILGFTVLMMLLPFQKYGEGKDPPSGLFPSPVFAHPLGSCWTAAVESGWAR